MFEWLLILCLALALHPFPRRRQILDAGNHSVEQIHLRLLPYSSCVFCLFSRQSEVVERRYVFTRVMAENDHSLTALVAGMTKRIFASTMTWGTKLFVVALNDCRNSTSSCTLLIVDSGKYLRVSSCAFNSSPLKSSLYN